MLALFFSEQANTDKQLLQQHDAVAYTKLKQLLIEICQDNAFSGMGNPTYIGNSVWRRSISAEHDLLYMIKADTCCIVACYGKGALG